MCTLCPVSSYVDPGIAIEFLVISLGRSVTLKVPDISLRCQAPLGWSLAQFYAYNCKKTKQTKNTSKSFILECLPS